MEWSYHIIKVCGLATLLLGINKVHMERKKFMSKFDSVNMAIYLFFLSVVFLDYED